MKKFSADEIRADLVHQLGASDKLDWDYFLETAVRAKITADAECINMTEDPRTISAVVADAKAKAKALESGDIADERNSPIDDDEIVLYSVSFFTVAVEVLRGKFERGHYEWRLVAENGKVLHQSDIGYGNPGVALRDGVLVVCDYPDSIRSAEIDQIRKNLK
jgi:hypothetical protein